MSHVLEIFYILCVLWFIDQYDNTWTLFIPTEIIDYLAVLRQMRPLTGQLNLYKSDFGVCAKKNKYVPLKFINDCTDCQLKNKYPSPSCFT